MKATVIILVSFIIVSCTDFDFDPEYKIDPLVLDYVNEFYREASKRNVFVQKDNLVVELADIKNQGLFYNRTQKVIQLNRSFVINHLLVKTTADSNFVKLAVWHEMGHSIGRKHCANLSIMNSDPFTFDTYYGDFVLTVRFYNESAENKKFLIDELFYNK